MNNEIIYVHSLRDNPFGKKYDNQMEIKWFVRYEIQMPYLVGTQVLDVAGLHNGYIWTSTFDISSQRDAFLRKYHAFVLYPDTLVHREWINVSMSIILI